MTTNKVDNSEFNVSNILVPYSIPKQFNKDATPGLMFIAEAPGKTEEELGKPLVGDAGKNFDKWLKIIDVKRDNIIIANVFKFRPQNNKVDYFFCTDTIAKNQNVEIVASMGKFNSKSLIKHFEPEIKYLYDTIVKYKPNVVVSMGGIATWALLGLPRITLVHGIVHHKTFTSGKKSFNATVVPCFHPASVIYTHNKEEKEQQIIAAFKLAYNLAQGIKG